MSQDVKISVNISSVQLKHMCQKCEDHSPSALKLTRQEVDQGEDHSAVGRRLIPDKKSRTYKVSIECQLHFKVKESVRTSHLSLPSQ